MPQSPTPLDVFRAAYKQHVEEFKRLKDRVNELSDEVMGKDGDVAVIRETTRANATALTGLQKDVKTILKHQQVDENKTQRTVARWKFFAALTSALIAAVSALAMALV